MQNKKTPRAKKFIRATGYKINKQKPTALLYINNKHVEIEIKIEYYLQSLYKMKYLGVNLTKFVHELIVC